MGKTHSNSTTHVSITSKEGIKEDITDKEKMEKAIIEENVKKFHQTENTCPFLKHPLKEQFGYFGEGPAMEQVYQGNYQPLQHLDEYTKEFLEVCKKDTVTVSQRDKKLH